ncbi:hypothetical protein EVAR_96506_1 [Eumeta japonica]|uniref:Uncharacterized protein n=1 Tax=Eumeta variegata TaxID=151549 RepID=A0A4C1ZS35_EUMVA|nr:hypothetical protein EVAR_96506_1 [Eumeta japonica]
MEDSGCNMQDGSVQMQKYGLVSHEGAARAKGAVLMEPYEHKPAVLCDHHKRAAQGRSYAYEDSATDVGLHIKEEVETTDELMMKQELDIDLMVLPPASPRTSPSSLCPIHLQANRCHAPAPAQRRTQPDSALFSSAGERRMSIAPLTTLASRSYAAVTPTLRSTARSPARASVEYARTRVFLVSISIRRRPSSRVVRTSIASGANPCAALRQYSLNNSNRVGLRLEGEELRADRGQDETCASISAARDTAAAARARRAG